jgi:hypothetical protein
MSYENAEPDFSPDDRGGYQPADVDGFTAAEVEAKIMAALTDSDGHDDGRAFRTLPRIKEHAELSKASDISEILFNMIEDGKIKKHENGDFTCYFLFNENPKRFWRNGDGTVGAEFPEVDAPHPFADQIGRPAVPAAYSQPILDQKPYSKQKIEIDPTALEEAMSKHGKQGKAAKELGIGYSTLYMKMSQQAALKQAHDRGLERYRKARPKPTKTSKKQEKNMSTATATALSEEHERSLPEARNNQFFTKINFTEQEVEDAAAIHGQQKATAAALGFDVRNGAASFRDRMRNHPEIKAAFERGVARYNAENPDGFKKPKLASIVNLKDDLLERLEDCAIQGMTIPRAAEITGINYYTLLDHIKDKRTDKSIKEAWERGLTRRKKLLSTHHDEVSAEEDTETILERHDREIAQVAIDEIGPNPETSTEEPQRSIAPDPQEIQANEPGHTGAETTGGESKIAAREFAPSFEGPIERFNQSVDPFSEPAGDKPFHSIRIRNIKADVEEPDDLPSFDRPTSIMKEIFEIQREAAAEFSQAPVSTRFLPFGKAGEIILGFEGNYFDLTKDERRFLETIADRLDGYGKPTPRKRTILQRFADWMANL